MKKIWFEYLTFLTVIGLMPLVLAKIPNASQIVSIEGKVSNVSGRVSNVEVRRAVGQRLENKNQKLIVSGNENDSCSSYFSGSR